MVNTRKNHYLAICYYAYYDSHRKENYTAQAEYIPFSNSLRRALQITIMSIISNCYNIMKQTIHHIGTNNALSVEVCTKNTH